MFAVLASIDVILLAWLPGRARAILGAFVTLSVVGAAVVLGAATIERAILIEP